MATPSKTLMDLEQKFWQSLVDQDTDAALGMLDEPALMVSPHGAIKFDHAGYRKMADQGSMIVKSFEFDDMQVVFPNPSTAILTYSVRQGVAPRGKGETKIQEMNDSSTWIKTGNDWKCVMHSETPAAKEMAKA